MPELWCHQLSFHVSNCDRTCLNVFRVTENTQLPMLSSKYTCAVCTAAGVPVVLIRMRSMTSSLSTCQTSCSRWLYLAWKTVPILPEILIMGLLNSSAFFLV